MAQQLTNREQRILEHMPLVEEIARHVFVHLPAFRRQPAHLDDLVSTGSLGLIAAVDSFDESMGLQLRTFAQYRVRGAMLDWLRDQDWAPRGPSVREKAKQVAETQRKLQVTLRREPTEEEVACDLQVSLPEYRQWVFETGRANLLSLDLECSEPARCSATQAEQLSKLEQSELRHKLYTLLRDLPEEERNVLSLHYINGLQGRQIARRTAMHESRVTRLRKRAVAKLRHALEPEFLGGWKRSIQPTY